MVSADMITVPMNRLFECPWNPRRSYPVDGLQQMAESIRTYGLLEPMLVRRQSHRYEILAGTRRFRAAALAGLDAVPCRDLGEVDDFTAKEITVIENLEREQLNIIEEAESLAMLLTVNGGIHSEMSLGRLLNRSQSWVGDRTRLLRLPVELQDQIVSGRLTKTHSRAISPWDNLPRVMRALVAAFAEDAEDMMKRWPHSLHEILWNHSRVPSAEERGGGQTGLDIREVPCLWGGTTPRIFDDSDRPAPKKQAAIKRSHARAIAERTVLDESKTAAESNTEGPFVAATRARLAPRLSLHNLVHASEEAVRKIKMLLTDRSSVGWLELEPICRRLDEAVRLYKQQ